MRVKGSEWNALLKEGNTGWRRSAAALWIITGVAPGAACSRSSSPQRGHRKAAQCTSQPALHKIQQKAPIEWTAENILQYDAEQYNLSDVSIREHFLCSSRKTAAICRKFLFVLYCSCVFLNARCFSAVWTDKLDLSRHDFCWFTCLRFGYFCTCIITLLCDSAFKHMLISSFLHCKVERCLTSLWFCVILYLLLLYFCIYAFVYFSVLVHWWVEWWQSGAARGLPLVLHCLSRSFDHHQITSLGLLFAQHVRRRRMAMVTMYTTMLKVFENLVLYVWW